MCGQPVTTECRTRCRQNRATLALLRAGIVDALPQTKRGEIRQLVEQHGITAEMLTEDLAEFAGLEQEHAR